MNSDTKNGLLGVGIACQLIGFFCFLTFWLMYGAILFFLLGAALILLSRKKWYLKIFSISPMLFALGLILNVLTFEKYVLPADFKGVVLVMTDEENGQEKEYSLFRRVYRIPSSGVLFTKFDQEEGLNYRKFYLSGQNGELKELGVLDYRHFIEDWVVNPPKTEPSRDSFAVFTPQLQHDFAIGDYTTFTVGKYKEIQAWNYLPEERMDSLRNKIRSKDH